MTNKPKEQNHEMYCDKDFCKYGDPSCPVIVRNATNKPPPRQFWYNREKMGERALEFWHSMFETRWYPEEEYDTLQAELDEARARFYEASLSASEAIMWQRRRIQKAEALLRDVLDYGFLYTKEKIKKYFAEAKRE